MSHSSKASAELQVSALNAFSDNYIWLIRRAGQHEVIAVDPGEAAPVIEWLESDEGSAYQLTDILITHHHHDHTGGVAELVERYGARVSAPAHCKSVSVDRPLREGDTIELFGITTHIWETPGHTLDHIVYLVDTATPLLFCGDTLFHAGCGRLFEGSAAQMQANFARLAELPGNTLVYGAHEYTQANLEFARQVEPDNSDIAADIERVEQLRQQQRPSLPSSIELEQRVNPFMRYQNSAVVQALEAHSGQTPADETEAFALLRSWKDNA
ncbi:hydroxyacylglutathione hydrolase [Carnimonas bestiolae]|uniref:hydroxyacylglutathione hydrolase n=1 Tax=Carnimonas bestiolae TaxID=3402172 RepID=UPI003EDBD901